MVILPIEVSSATVIMIPQPLRTAKSLSFLLSKEFRSYILIISGRIVEIKFVT